MNDYDYNKVKVGDMVTPTNVNHLSNYFTATKPYEVIGFSEVCTWRVVRDDNDMIHMLWPDKWDTGCWKIISTNQEDPIDAYNRAMGIIGL